MGDGDGASGAVRVLAEPSGSRFLGELSRPLLRTRQLLPAAGALRDIDQDKAKLLAQFDAVAEAVLNELGLLGGGNWSD